MSTALGRSASAYPSCRFHPGDRYTVQAAMSMSQNPSPHAATARSNRSSLSRARAARAAPAGSAGSAAGDWWLKYRTTAPRWVTGRTLQLSGYGVPSLR